MRKARYNQFTRGVLCSFGLLALSLLLFAGKLLFLEAMHPQVPLKFPPLATAARRDLHAMPLLANRLGILAAVSGGEAPVSDYSPNTRGERQLQVYTASAIAASAGQPSCNAAVMPRGSATRPLPSSLRRLASRLVLCFHGATRLGWRMIEPALSAKTG